MAAAGGISGNKTPISPMQNAMEGGSDGFAGAAQAVSVPSGNNAAIAAALSAKKGGKLASSNGASAAAKPGAAAQTGAATQTASASEIAAMQAIGDQFATAQATAATNVAAANLPPATGPQSTELTQAQMDGVLSFADTMGGIDMFAGMNADQLLAQFLKINIEDPNNSVETLNKLHELSSENRQMALDDQQKQIAAAEKLQKEAEAKADSAAQCAQVVQIVVIVVAIVVAIFTCGAGLIVMAKAVALYAGIASAVGGVAVADANAKAAHAQADATQGKLKADSKGVEADEAQKALEEQAAMIEMAIQSKDEMLSAMINMMKAAFATKLKLASAASGK